MKHKAYFRYTCAVLTLVAVTYVVASATHCHLSLVATGGAALLLAGALSWGQTTARETGTRISWSIFGFIAGMIIIVRAIEDTSLTAMFGRWLLQLSGGTSLGAVMVGTAGAALGTNLINSERFWRLDGATLPLRRQWGEKEGRGTKLSTRRPGGGPTWCSFALALNMAGKP